MRILNSCLVVLVCLSASGYCAQYDNLYSAAQEGDVSEVNRLLLDGYTDAAALNSDGNTAIHFAVANGHLEIVEILLLNDVNVNIENAGLFTPLHVAAHFGRANIAEFLLKKKANVNALSTQKDTPLHRAAVEGHVEVVKLLLYYGANLNAANSKGQAPLDIANKKVQKEITALINKAKKEKNKVTKCRTKSSLSECVENELINIAYKGDSKRKLFWLIRDNEVNTNFKGTDDHRLLHIAAFNGHKDLVEGLLICNADVSAVNNEGRTALHFAARQGHTKIADLLIRNGANIEAVDNDGSSPLYYAAFHGHWELVYLLLLNGADANKQMVNGNTALHAATQEDHEETIKVLLQSNANRHLKNSNGVSAMDLASENSMWMFQEIRSPVEDACAQYSQLRFPHKVHPRGKRASDAEPANSFEFPWMAAIFYKATPESDLEFHCGGTIISDKFILTAAHCIEYNSQMIVRLGTEFIYAENNKGEDYYVEEIIRLNYRVTLEEGAFIQNKHDIALLRLNRTISFSNTRKPACLQIERHREIECNETLVVSGWGKTEDGTKPTRLLKTDLVTMPNSDCAEYLAEMEETESQFCAYDTEFKNDACRGDSGGPLQTFRSGSFVSTVVGIVSYGLAPCPSMAPGIYTKLAFYLDWIQSHVWPEQTAMKNIEDKNFNNFDSGEYSTSYQTLEGETFDKNFVEKTYGRYTK